MNCSLRYLYYSSQHGLSLAVNVPTFYPFLTFFLLGWREKFKKMWRASESDICVLTRRHQKITGKCPDLSTCLSAAGNKFLFGLGICVPALLPFIHCPHKTWWVLFLWEPLFFPCDVLWSDVIWTWVARSSLFSINCMGGESGLIIGSVSLPPLKGSFHISVPALPIPTTTFTPSKDSWRPYCMCWKNGHTCCLCYNNSLLQGRIGCLCTSEDLSGKFVAVVKPFNVLYSINRTIWFKDNHKYHLK